MIRFLASVAVVLSLSNCAFGQGRLLATGRNANAGYLETRGQSLDKMPTESEAASLGLQINWLKTAESFQPYVGDPSAVLWPDRVDQDARVILKSGNRIVAEIHANQRNVDYARYGVYDRASGDEPNVLGMEGARKVAEKIAADYKLLKRSIEIEEVVAPKTYLTVASDRGSVEMFDAETGIRLWKTSLGDGTLPIVGPAMDNEMVCLLVGAKAYLLNKETGGILHEVPLDASVSTMPVAVGKLLFVPQVNGVLTTYNRDDLMNIQVSFGFSKALAFPPIASADGNMVAWTLGRFVYTAKVDGRAELWSRLDTVGRVTSTPAIVSDGFIAATDDGTVLKMSMERYNSIQWRENVGFPILARPICNEKYVLVISAGGDVICLNEVTGKMIWNTKIPGVSSPLALSEKHAYFQDLAGGLISVSLEDGAVDGRIVKALAKGIRNDYSDRIYLRGLDGRLMCLREKDQTQPYFLPIVKVMQGGKIPAKANGAKPQDETPTQPESSDTPVENENPFGAGDNPIGGDASDNPFGGDAGSNPFGGGAAGDNPFGS